MSIHNRAASRKRSIEQDWVRRYRPGEPLAPRCPKAPTTASPGHPTKIMASQASPPSHAVVGQCCWTLVELAKAREWRGVWERAQSPHTCPSEFTIVDNLGQCALHYAVINSAPVDIIKLLTFHPTGKASALIGNREGGWTPLHLACRSDAPDEIIIALATGVPSAVSMKDIDGDTVLHSACRYGASEHVLHNLIGICNYQEAHLREFPQFLNWRSPMFLTDNEGNLPIHSAVQHESTVDVISCLLESNPQSFCSLNNEGLSPLHLACVCERDDVIARMIERVLNSSSPETEEVPMFLEVVHTRDHDGKTPVSLLWYRLLGILSKQGDKSAIDKKDQIEILKSIVLILAATSRLKNPQDSRLTGTVAKFRKQLEDEESIPHTFLHAAITAGNEVCPPHLLHLFVECYPGILSTPDEYGRLPLHYAATSAGRRRSRNFTNRLLSLQVPRTPWLQRTQDPCQKQNFCSCDIKCMESDDLVEVNEGRNEFPSLSEPNHDPNSSFLTSQCTTQHVHDDILTTIIKTCPSAALAKDKSDRLPLHAAILAGAPWEGAIEHIFEAAPSSLEVSDGPTGLMPFMLASCNEVGCDINVVYNLLLSGPDLVS